MPFLEFYPPEFRSFFHFFNIVLFPFLFIYILWVFYRYKKKMYPVWYMNFSNSSDCPGAIFIVGLFVLDLIIYAINSKIVDRVDLFTFYFFVRLVFQCLKYVFLFIWGYAVFVFIKLITKKEYILKKILQSFLFIVFIFIFDVLIWCFNVKSKAILEELYQEKSVQQIEMKIENKKEGKTITDEFENRKIRNKEKKNE